MAKAKKAKNEERDNSNSEAVVKHQKLCLSIDMENHLIYGYTELQIVVPDNGVVGLHVDNLAIEKVIVDGEPAEFEVFPHYQHLDPKDRWCAVSSSTSAADASGSVYLSSLELELLPNLLIMCSRTAKADTKEQEHPEVENGGQLSADASRLSWVQNLKLVRIDYWVEKADSGIHFNENVLHTNNQLRRARCWFPCMDDSLQCCCYDLEFTVPSNFVAVSSGALLHQVLTKDDPPRKTFIYKLDVPVAAQWISLAVAQFEILSDRHSPLLSHFCLPDDLSKLRNTVIFFHNAFSHYEDYLSASFPFGSYTQVFIAPEMVISSCSLGASTSIFSSHLLFDERIIDQTIHTRIKLAYALARQWFGVYVTPEAPNDEWLLDGLAGFLADSFIKRFLGNNEARYRRYKANCAVCQADDSGATSLNSALASKDLYGTQSFGFYGKIRSWKSVAVLQMLEKQMGPESFRKILQHIIIRARDANRLLRTLSTKEFRHLANKIGNLERPFLKEFFPRWVGSCGCPVLKMGFSYNKRKNMIELAVLRGCTSWPDLLAGANKVNPDSDNRETDVGWPGMMSIRIHELDGMYDHPILPMAGEPWQLMEIQCHSKLAAKRFLKPKKGSKHDGSDDNGDGATTTDLRLNSDSPILWLRADPEMEYLAEVHFNQPVQMWINQLEKDKDVVAQAHAITVLEELPQLSFPVINALNNFLNDSKAFWRVRIQAAYALATTASEDTDWAGLHYLINFYKSRRFNPNIGLPRPNDFHDFQEYFVLETVPHAIALVRSSDKKSPREAVEFILQLLKSNDVSAAVSDLPYLGLFAVDVTVGILVKEQYNDNNGNGFSDVFWLAALVHAVGELEFGQQSIVCLPSLLKRLDRLLQFDRFMPSHNGILTISCLQSLTQMALKLSEFIPLDHVIELIKPYQLSKTWQIQVEAGRALLEVEFQCKGIDAALTLFIRYLKDEISLRGQTKLGVCALRLAQMAGQSDGDNIVKGDTLVALLRLLESPLSFNNVILRHYIFCILQVLAGRAPTLYGIPKDETLRMGHSKTCSELKNIFAALIKQSKPPEPSSYPSEIPHDLSVPDSFVQTDALPENHEMVVSGISRAPDTSLVPITQNTGDASKDGTYQRNLMSIVTEPPAIIPNVSSIIDDRGHIDQATHPLAETSVDINVEASRGEQSQVSIRPEMEPAVHIGHDSMIEQPPKETVIGPEIQERIKKPKLKIKVKHSAASSKAVDPDNARNLKTQQGQNDAELGASSSVSVDAPQRNLAETVSTGGQNVEDANSCHDVGSRVTASIGSAKPSEELVKELQCTADSSKVSLPLPPDNNHLHAEPVKIDQEPQRSEHLYVSPVGPSRHDAAGSSVPRSEEKKEKKKDKDTKRKKNNHNDDPERSEKKRQKKEKKRKEKDMAKLLSNKSKTLPSVELGSQGKRLASVEREAKPTSVVLVGKEHPPETRQGIVQGEGAISSADELRRRQYPETSSGSLQQKPAELSESNAAVVKRVDGGANAPQIQGAGTPKIRIRFKKRTLGEK